MFGFQIQRESNGNELGSIFETYQVGHSHRDWRRNLDVSTSQIERTR